MAKVKNEATRQKILCTAYKRFVDYGYENVLLKDIATDCGISLSLLQHYYRKKEMILTHIVYDMVYKVLSFQKSHVAPELLDGPYSAHLADTVFYELFYSLFRADNYRLLKVYKWVLNNASMLNEGILLCKDFLAELYGLLADERYEILDVIGEGGMAVVFKARDRLLSRFVAIKILRPEYTKDAMFIESFRRESQIAAGLVHPNIVNVYDVEQPYRGEVYHFDCYRLKDIREAMDFGAEEYLYSGNYCLIEWPDMISPILPEDTVWIKIRPLENGDRELTIEN